MSDRAKSASAPDTRRRGLLRFGAVVAAVTGASAVSAVGANAAPGDKPQPNDFIPTVEKGAPSGVATLDGATKLRVAQLPDPGVIHAKYFGVKADGVTDDIASLQSALDAAVVGSVVILPPGTLKISAPLYVKSGVAIKGSIGTQITQVTPGQSAIVSRNYNSALYGGLPTGHTVISDLRINVPAAAGSHGIILRDYYSRIINVQVAGGDRAFFLTALNDAGATVGGTLVENRIHGCKATNYIGYGFYLGAQDNNKLTDGFISDCLASGSAGSTAHVFIGSSAGWQVRGIHTYGTSAGHSIQAHAAFNTSISDIHIETWTSGGLVLTSAQQAVALSNLMFRAPNVPNLGAVYVTRSGAFSSLRVSASNVHVTQNYAVPVTAFHVVSSEIYLEIVNFAASGTQAARVTRSNSATSRKEDGLNIIGTLDHDGSMAGFFGAAPITKPVLNYSRTGETDAAAQIRRALASLGLVTDSTAP